MLDADVANIVDTLSRTSALREEDARLLCGVVSGDATYRTLLAGEVRGRESWRRRRESTALSQMRKWQRGVTASASSAASPATLATASAAGRTALVYGSPLWPIVALTVREAYGLEVADLSPARSPFAGMPAAAVLYTSPALQPMRSDLFRPITGAASDDGGGCEAVRAQMQMLEDLFPLPPPSAAAERVSEVKRETRERLLALRKQWHVLLLLWLGAAATHSNSSSSGNRNDLAISTFGEEWFSIPSTASEAFLSEQQGIIEKRLRQLTG